MSAKGAHLFVIGPDAYLSMTQEEVKATVKDLKVLDLYYLPYDRISVRLPLDYACVLEDTAQVDNNPQYYRRDSLGRLRPNLGPGNYLQYDNINLLGEPSTALFIGEGHGEHKRFCFPADRGDVLIAAQDIADGLIALLATRNIIKSVEHNKLARLGIGGKRAGSARRFEYVTTISVPSKLEENHESVREGREVAPHLRRGHIRHQRYGPGLAYFRQIWIAPVFVNADKEWVSKRRAYNVGP
jgi:hypothetical protein